MPLLVLGLSMASVPKISPPGEEHPSPLEEHVDVLINEPVAGYQKLLVKVGMNPAGELELQLPPGSEARGERTWTYLRSRVDFEPEDAPRDFLEALYHEIDATYVCASLVHDEKSCPFRGQLEAHISF